MSPPSHRVLFSPRAQGREPERTMADFVKSSETKSAVRKLASQIADVAAFNTIVHSVITTNSFACVAYMTAGVNHPAVEKIKEAFTAKFVYQDALAKTVGTGSPHVRHPGKVQCRCDCTARCRCGQHGTWRVRGPRSREGTHSFAT
jgi:hypothetical protein